MTGMRFLAAIVSALVLIASPHDALAKKEKRTGTLKDLAGKEIEVKPEPPVDVQPRQAADEYRRFLERRAGNADLQVEAMRRLGDLNVESDELLRGEVDASTMTVAELREAIKLYQTLLTQYPRYARADAVIYQLARAYEADRQPELSLDA